jgi:hypothetical protein
MKRFTGVALSLLLILLMTSPVIAWEFKMAGETEWRYRYWTRTGNDDIFGAMDRTVNLGINHLQTFPTTSTTNRGTGTFGVIAGENRFGADMQRNDYRMTIFPKINVNKAISIEASVNLTSLGIWSDGQPLVGSGLAATSTNPGYVNSLYVPIQDRPVNVDVPNTYVTLQWLKTSIKTPMLDFSIGYKTSKIGMGLWKHECNRASSSFGVSAHYGPFKIGFSPYFGREQSAWALGTARSRIEGNGASQRQEDRRDYFRAVIGEVEYNNGPLSLLLVSDSYHQPNSPVPDARFAAISSSARPNEDILRYRIALAGKYFNGRYFLNAEADWFTRWRSGRGTAENANLVRQNRDNEAWLYGLETGVVCGPSKVTLNYVRATGDDPSTRHTTEDAADSEQGLSACYMKDWGYLMYYMYGTGDGWDAAGYGQPTNFQHVGGKVDYAVAANLNIFGLFSYAWRDQPNAYTLGGDWRGGIRPFTNDDIAFQQGIIGAASGRFAGQQAVPDHAREIGWEVDAGLTWKLLENLNWNTIFAYWKPGIWWSYAYPDTAAIYRANGGASIASSAANGPVATSRVGRNIDPLFATETSIMIKF